MHLNRPGHFIPEAKTKNSQLDSSIPARYRINPRSKCASKKGSKQRRNDIHPFTNRKKKESQISVLKRNGICFGKQEIRKNRLDTYKLPMPYPEDGQPFIHPGSYIELLTTLASRLTFSYVSPTCKAYPRSRKTWQNLS